MSQLCKLPIITHSTTTIGFIYGSHLMSRWAAINEESVPLYKLPEGVTDGVACPPDSYSFHHARVSQLAAAQLTVKQLQKETTYFEFLNFH